MAPAPDAAPNTAANADQGADERGFVLVWFALLLLVLVAMAGFGVDVWNWWYTSQKVQRAADAGALAGVTFMPQNLNGTSPNATTTATGVVLQNGYSGSNVTVQQGDKPNQLLVTVTTTVNNFFTSLLGYKSTTITRSGTAEFNAPIQMGSPVGHLANDPDSAAAIDNHWLNIGAPGVNKRTGDRFADFANCSINPAGNDSAYKCDGSAHNTEYSDGTYVFTVEIPTTGGNVDIQAYDPEYANGGGGGSSCDNQWLTGPGAGTQITTLIGQGYNDAATRYARFNSKYCTGDDDTNLSGNAAQATAWIVRDSSVSLYDPFANPVVASGGPSGAGSACAHQFKGYSPNSDHYWYDLLDTTNAQSSYDADFAAAFHKWYTLCNVSFPASPLPRKYFIQVRSNVPYDASKVNNESYLRTTGLVTNNIGGQNRYSLRVVNHGGTMVPSGYGVFAETKLPVYTNTAAGVSPTFYLARLLPGGGTTGRLLDLQFYDIGDIGGGTTTMTIIPPADAGGGAITCPAANWTAGTYAGDGQPLPSDATLSAAMCSLSTITSDDATQGGNNGVLIDVKVSVPGNYTCGNGYALGVNDPNACWFKIQMSYTSGAQANDTTTWVASIGGDPIRLVK